MECLHVFAQFLLTIPLLLFISLCLLVQQKPASPTPKAGSGQLPPGPKPWPVVGCLPEMLRNRPIFRWVLRVCEGNDITCIRLGGMDVFVISCSELAREFIRGHHDETFASRPMTMATELASRGYLSVALAPWGPHWKKMRRVIVSEVNSPARFRAEEGVRADEADHLVRHVYHQSKKHSAGGKEGVDIRLATRYYTTNLIRMMLFGRRHFGLAGLVPGDEEVEHIDVSFTILSLLFSFCPSDFMPCLRIFDIGGHEKMMRKATKVMDKYHNPIIEERIRRRRRVPAAAAAGDKPQDIIDVLVSLEDRNGKPLLTFEEIKAQSEEMIYATVDNTSNTVEWAIAEMLDKPDILRRAVDEIESVVGKDRLVQESDFSKLPFVKACAREALRLHPLAPFNIPHFARADTTFAGYSVTKGSIVLVSRVGLGLNPNVWADPLRFDPERHLKDGNVELTEPDLKFISFPAGRRGCMGASLGSAMIYMMLGRLIQAFSWSLPEGVAAVDLSEDESSLFMAKPLHAVATPRLSFLDSF